MITRLLVIFVLMLFSGVAFGASPNPSVEERLAILETTMKLQFDALSKQIEANRQSTLKLIEVSNEATNKRIDTLNNWGIALFAGVLAWTGVFITHALGFWGVSKRDNTVTATTDVDRPEASPVIQSADA